MSAGILTSKLISTRLFESVVLDKFNHLEANSVTYHTTIDTLFYTLIDFIFGFNPFYYWGGIFKHESALHYFSLKRTPFIELRLLVLRWAIKVASYKKIVSGVHQRNERGFKRNSSVHTIDIERAILRLAALFEFRHISILLL